MERDFSATIIYTTTTLVHFYYLDGVFGGEPITHGLFLIHLAAVGTIICAVAGIASLFSLRIAVIYGLVSLAFSWPYFAWMMLKVPWNGGIPILPNDWVSLLGAIVSSLLAAIVTLIVSTIYSVNTIRTIARNRTPCPVRHIR